MERVYFDNSATTPMDPRVREAMLPFLDGVFGNPSSLHLHGREAKAAVDEARLNVARLFDAEPDEVVFTASGTEADNLALKGILAAEHGYSGHVVTTAFEHPAVRETCLFLETQGVTASYIPVEENGIVSRERYVQAFRPGTKLVSVMAANNVVGTLQPIADMAAFAKERGAVFHTDAVQAAGKVPLSLKKTPIDLVSLSGHKLNGPKGIGALIVRRGVKLAPIVHGGGQERGLRSATENVAGIVGLGMAAKIALSGMTAEAARLVNLREALIEGIQRAIPNAYLIGHRYRRLPGHVSIGLAGQEAEAIKLMLALDEAGFSVSTGSACSSGHTASPSYVLQAMGFDPIRARGSLRITLGRFNSDAEVARFLDYLPEAARGLRSITTRKHETSERSFV